MKQLSNTAATLFAQNMTKVQSAGSTSNGYVRPPAGGGGADF